MSVVKFHYGNETFDIDPKDGKGLVDGMSKNGVTFVEVSVCGGKNPVLLATGAGFPIWCQEVDDSARDEQEK